MHVQGKMKKIISVVDDISKKLKNSFYACIS